MSARRPENTASLVRRIRYGNAVTTIDTANEIALILNLSETHAAWRRIDGRTTAADPKIGAITLTPPGRSTTFGLDGSSSGLIMRLPWPETAAGYAATHDIDPARLEVQPRLTVVDPILARLVYAACDVGGEETFHAITERLLTAHSGHAARNAPALLRGGLSPIQIRRVEDRVESGLAGPLTLATMADEAGLSPFHFAREFRRTVGVSPHQFVLRRRVDRAIALLARRNMTVARIAALTGFADDRHLARHMRRQTGLGPGRFRTRILPENSRNGPA